jgi:hypothetical protein
MDIGLQLSSCEIWQCLRSNFEPFPIPLLPAEQVTNELAKRDNSIFIGQPDRRGQIYDLCRDRSEVRFIVWRYCGGGVTDGTKSSKSCIAGHLRWLDGQERS